MQGKTGSETPAIRTRRQKAKGSAWDPSWPAQPDHGGSDGEHLSDDGSDSDVEDIIGEARLERLATELKGLPVFSLYPDIATAGLEVLAY